MQNRDKIIQEVAKDLGFNPKKVLGVVSSQTMLARKAMLGKESTSVYLRKVGTFLSTGSRKVLAQQKYDASIAKTELKKELKAKAEDKDDSANGPYEFK